MSNNTSKFTGEDVKVITLAIMGTALIVFLGVCLWFAVQGSVVAAMALTAVLFGGGFLIAQRASANNNAADNAQLIAALTRQQDPLPADQMYKVLQQRARAEEMIHRAERAAVNTAGALPAIAPAPIFDTSNVSIDID